MSKLSFSKLAVIFSIVSILTFFLKVHAETITCTLGSSCSTSPQTVSIGATVGSIPILDGGGGGGGYQSGVRFSGYAYPGATVVVQKGTAFADSVKADDLGAFSIVIPETTWQFFSLYATDVQGRRSTLLNFSTVLYSGYLTEITGIRFAPTITTDKIAVRQGDYLSVTGAALPGAGLELLFDGPASTTFTLDAERDGTYTITIPVDLAYGDYGIKIHYKSDGRFSKVVRVIVGAANTLRNDTTINIPGDCNFDQRVTLVDFSVLAYWYGKDNPPRCVDTNHDGLIDLVDFSILAFYWSS